MDPEPFKEGKNPTAFVPGATLCIWIFGALTAREREGRQKCRKAESVTVGYRC